jgi:hypothetical protein
MRRAQTRAAGGELDVMNDRRGYVQLDRRPSLVANRGTVLRARPGESSDSVGNALGSLRGVRVVNRPTKYDVRIADGHGRSGRPVVGAPVALARVVEEAANGATG